VPAARACGPPTIPALPHGRATERARGGAAQGTGPCGVGGPMVAAARACGPPPFGGGRFEPALLTPFIQIHASHVFMTCPSSKSPPRRAHLGCAKAFGEGSGALIRQQFETFSPLSRNKPRPIRVVPNTRGLRRRSVERVRIVRTRTAGAASCWRERERGPVGAPGRPDSHSTPGGLRIGGSLPVRPAFYPGPPQISPSWSRLTTVTDLQRPRRSPPGPFLPLGMTLPACKRSAPKWKVDSSQTRQAGRVGPIRRQWHYAPALSGEASHARHYSSSRSWP
jgi:hypothetical protein